MLAAGRTTEAVRAVVVPGPALVPSAEACWVLAAPMATSATAAMTVPAVRLSILIRESSDLSALIVTIPFFDAKNDPSPPRMVVPELRVDFAAG
ncbi:hypothetical protein Asera_25360 [Actinocatenispora sera]|uniref:Uncharacterized protein n=1 Tax=Actinocatenispora sera TaxID=390989 RepID=A0A810L2N4_9ACTN|nr:hypothetical protein Asera_25360 [Actinocatenispora sera]